MTSVEKVADSPMAPVGVLGRDAIEVPHALGQIAIWCVDNKMRMVPHQARGVAEPMPSREDVAQYGKKHLPIVVMAVYGFLSAIPRGDMRHGTWEFEAQRPSHASSLSPFWADATFLDLNIPATDFAFFVPPLPLSKRVVYFPTTPLHTEAGGPLE